MPDDEARVVDDLEEWEDTQPNQTTGKYETLSPEWMAGLEVGLAKGRNEREVEVFAAVRLALLSVGVEPHLVEPILGKIRGFLPNK